MIMLPLLKVKGNIMLARSHGNNNFFIFATCIVALLILPGCATVSGSGTSQPISVQTFQSDGTELDGARCDMTNDEGTWFVMTPGSTTVRKSNKDLQVVCRKTGIDVGTASVVSRTKGNMWGNIILGGGIGAVVDHNNGAAYEYPGLIKIYMGRANQKIDETSPQASFGSNTTTVPGVTQQSVQPISGPSTLNTENAEKKCSELGFSKGTENFGNCVLKLAK
jgi:hypothetical protein